MRYVEVVMALLVGAIACSGHTAPLHVEPDESGPHISWEIRAGQEGEGQFVCSSVRLADACLIPLSTDQRRTPVTVHVQLHATKVETRYQGNVRPTFFVGAADPHVGQVDVTVSPGSAPFNTSLTDVAIRTPGTYALTIALDAVQGGRTASRITANVPVTVK